MLYRVRWGLVAYLLCFVFLLTACTDRMGERLAARPVATEQSARELLTQAIDYTLANDLESLCGLAGSVSMCEIELNSGSLARVPTRAPNVACSYTIPDVVHATSRSLGGRVLVVEGVDGADRRFVTEVLVFHDGARFVATNAVWWSGMGITAPDEAGRGITVGPMTLEDRLRKCEGPATAS